MKERIGCDFKFLVWVVMWLVTQEISEEGRFEVVWGNKSSEFSLGHNAFEIWDIEKQLYCVVWYFGQVLREPD